MSTKNTSDPRKPIFIYDTRGDWFGTVIDGFIWDTRGEYVGFIRGAEQDVYTAPGEWIGRLIRDGRIVRKRTAQRRPLLKDAPPHPPKPDRFPAHAPLPPLTAELPFTVIDVLEWDPDIFRRISDQVEDLD